MIEPEIVTAIEDIIAPTMRRMAYRGLPVEEGHDRAGAAIEAEVRPRAA